MWAQLLLAVAYSGVFLFALPTVVVAAEGLVMMV
jgi:hypothetical protein